MPDKPSRRDRRRITQRTGRRSQRLAPAAPWEAPDTGQPPPAVAPAAGSTASPSSRAPSPPPPQQSPVHPPGLAPSAARAAAYLQERQREIVRELRGLGIAWALVLGLFAAIVTLLSIL